jgi:hypothetical protein
MDGEMFSQATAVWEDELSTNNTFLNTRLQISRTTDVVQDDAHDMVIISVSTFISSAYTVLTVTHRKTMEKTPWAPVKATHEYLLGLSSVKRCTSWNVVTFVQSLWQVIQLPN